jgi:deazaflavin-dependent oxidoreductase (nitroreductase family)
MSAHSAQPRSGSVTPRPPRLGRRMAHFNRAVTNKISIHVAGWAPGLGIVIHVGRRTRTVYRTPVNVFRTKDGFRFALTYGRDAEWVRNALAHGAVRLVTHRREYELTNPEIVHDPHRQHVGLVGRSLMRVMRVSDFLDFTRAGNGTAAPAGGPGPH